MTILPPTQQSNNFRLEHKYDADAGVEAAEVRRHCPETEFWFLWGAMMVVEGGFGEGVGVEGDYLGEESVGGCE